MIGWLSGKVVQAVPDRLILDVGGVGYQVAIPLSTYYEIQKADVGAAIRLYIHTHVREDALALYGFWSEREKELFERLIAVSGIGPRLAQVVLSGMAPDELPAASTPSRQSRDDILRDLDAHVASLNVLADGIYARWARGLAH